MTSYISSDLRRLVIERAAGRREYCVSVNQIRSTDAKSITSSPKSTMALRLKAIWRLLVPTAIGTREQISVRLQNPPVNTSDFIIREQIIGLNTFDS